MKRRLTNIQKRLTAIAILAILLFLLSILEDHPYAIERYYSNGLYVAICKLIHPVLNLFPFSVGDILYIAVIAYLIYAAIKAVVLLFKKQFKRIGSILLGFIIGLQSAILL